RDRLAIRGVGAGRARVEGDGDPRARRGTEPRRGCRDPGGQGSHSFVAHARTQKETESPCGDGRMSDELDRLERAFRHQDPIRPADAARAAAVAAAMTVYEEKNRHASQGLRDDNRLRERGRALSTALSRRLSMTLTRPRLGHMLAGGVSLAALVLVLKLDLPLDQLGFG